MQLDTAQKPGGWSRVAAAGPWHGAGLCPSPLWAQSTAEVLVHPWKAPWPRAGLDLAALGSVWASTMTSHVSGPLDL